MRLKTCAIALVMILSGCTATTSLPTLSLTPDATVYRLGSGDMVKVTVFGEERLTGTYPVNGRGKISFPLLGEVEAGSKTLGELEQTLATALADGFIKNPNITIEVANFRPYYILGEVGKPGEYPYVDGMTVFAAVARAGGFSYRADQKRILIKHKATAQETLYRLESATPVQPGDTIRVAERSF